MLQSARKLTSFSFRRSTSAEHHDHDELCSQLSARIDTASLDALIQTGEVEAGAAAEAQLQATLLRFLRAESWDVAKAEKRLLQHVAWRLDYLPQGGVAEDDIRYHLDADKSFLQASGQKGRPLLAAVARNHLSGVDSQQLERFVVYCLEAASRYCWAEGNPDNKMYIIVDLNGIALKNLDASALRTCFALLNNHYPERAAGIVMYKAPAIFSGVWRVVAPFIDPVTRSKIKFVEGEQALAVLEEWVGLDIVPREYGGQAEAVPIQEATRRLRERAAGAEPHAALCVSGMPRTCRQCTGECSCNLKESAIQVAA